MNWDGFELGLDHLLGGAANTFTTAQATGTITGLSVAMGGGFCVRLCTLLDRLFKGIEESGLVSLLYYDLESMLFCWRS